MKRFRKSKWVVLATMLLMGVSAIVVRSVRK